MKKHKGQESKTHRDQRLKRERLAKERKSEAERVCVRIGGRGMGKTEAMTGPAFVPSPFGTLLGATKVAVTYDDGYFGDQKLVAELGRELLKELE